MGYYLAPYNALTMNRAVAAIVRRPRGTKLLVACDFNADISSLEGSERDEDISAALAVAVLEKMLDHFLPL